MAVAETRYARISRNHSFEPIYRSQSLEPLSRADSLGNYTAEQNYMEKRQLFLRSYQFSRKQSLTEKVKSSLVRAKRVIWRRLRSVRRMRKVVLSRFRCGFYYRRMRFLRLLHNNTRSSSSYCFC